MGTESDSSFTPIDVRLPRAVIEQAIDGELPYDFFREFTVKVPILPGVEVGEKLWVSIHLEGVGTIAVPSTVDQEMLDAGMLISQQSWSFPHLITEVSLRYELTRLSGDKFEARRRIYGLLQP